MESTANCRSAAACRSPRTTDAPIVNGPSRSAPVVMELTFALTLRDRPPALGLHSTILAVSGDVDRRLGDAKSTVSLDAPH
jgi:hypothetical protein